MQKYHSKKSQKCFWQKRGDFVPVVAASESIWAGFLHLTRRHVQTVQIKACLPPFSGQGAPHPPLLSWIDPPHVCVPGPPARFHWSAAHRWNHGENYSPAPFMELSLLVKRLHTFMVTAYRQDLVPLLQPAIQSCSSIFFDFGHINARVIYHILLINTSNYVESQTCEKKKNKIKSKAEVERNSADQACF